MWFRRDLRLGDNPALAAAAAAGAVLPVYIHAPAEEGEWPPGAASRWWLHHSLERLRANLRARGSELCIRSGEDSLNVLRALIRECAAARVVWNRCYEPAAVARDRTVKAALREAGIETSSYGGALLNEPWTVHSRSGGPFQVFTPYWRHCKSLDDPSEPCPLPRVLSAPAAWPASDPLESLELLPRLAWSDGIAGAWTPGSEAAHAQLARFLAEAFDDYGDRRDLPGLGGTSRLSPHLHFGEIGPREIWHAVRRHAERRGRHAWRDSQFVTELGWREFAHHLLFHFPHTPSEPLRGSFARFPWRSDPGALTAWRRGLTGYPIVDAGMRELWRTGWMHNRVRMIVASFLVKDLLLPWTDGARWFWDTLVDGDLAANTLGWQWAAGCGADAAPFFRIFNPVSQGTRFDPDGRYVRRWVPEVARLPDRWLHQPWAAPDAALREAGITLDRSYPSPLVDHDSARKSALAALKTLGSHR